jgi:hypothetical protein
LPNFKYGKNSYYHVITIKKNRFIHNNLVSIVHIIFIILNILNIILYIRLWCNA